MKLRENDFTSDVIEKIYQEISYKSDEQLKKVINREVYFEEEPADYSSPYKCVQGLLGYLNKPFSLYSQRAINEDMYYSFNDEDDNRIECYGEEIIDIDDDVDLDEIKQDFDEPIPEAQKRLCCFSGCDDEDEEEEIDFDRDIYGIPNKLYLDVESNILEFLIFNDKVLHEPFVKDTKATDPCLDCIIYFAPKFANWTIHFYTGLTIIGSLMLMYRKGRLDNYIQ